MNPRLHVWSLDLVLWVPHSHRFQSNLSGRYRRDLSIAEQHRIQELYAKIDFDNFETKLLEKIYQRAPLSIQVDEKKSMGTYMLTRTLRATLKATLKASLKATMY